MNRGLWSNGKVQVSLSNTGDRWAKNFLSFNDRTISPSASFMEFKYASKFFYIIKLSKQFDIGINVNGFKTLQLRW